MLKEEGKVGIEARRMTKVADSASRGEQAHVTPTVGKQIHWV